MESPKPRPINREKTLTFFAIFVLILYATLVCIGFVFDFYFHKIWFSLAIFCIGLNLLAKAMFFHLDSDFMLGLLGLTFGAASAVFLFFSKCFYVRNIFGAFGRNFFDGSCYFSPKFLFDFVCLVCFASVIINCV
jgi:hypothetical protein